MKKAFLYIVVFLFALGALQAQKKEVFQFSFASDLGVLRTTLPNQKGWALSPEITGHFSFTPRTGAYIKGVYFSTLHNHEHLWATAKSSSTALKQFEYFSLDTIKSTILHLGIKQYISGAYNDFKKTNIYLFAGAGVNFCRFYTSYQVYDTSLRFNPANYTYPIEPGHNRYKQLITEFGTGVEKHIGLDVFLYGEAKGLYSFTNSSRLYTPRSGKGLMGIGLTVGLRLLF